MMRASHPWLAWSLAAPLLAATSAPAAVSDPAAILRNIDSVQLQAGAAVMLRNRSIDIGQARLDIANGILWPTTPAGERAAEMIFIGEATLKVEPPNEVEEAQLELFTGDTSLEAPFREAVLVVARDPASDLMLAGAQKTVPDAARTERAQEIFEHWKSGSERRLLGVEGALFLDALGEPSMENYFAGWFRSTELGDFIYAVDPEAYEQVTLGQFVRMELSWLERRRARRDIHRAQRQGRLMGLDLEDLGVWDTWLSTTLRTSNGTSFSGSSGFEPENYAIDLTIQRTERKLSGTARLDLRANGTGHRGLIIRLNPDLRIQRIAAEDGTNLAYRRIGGVIYVALPRAYADDEKVSVYVQYEGQVIERAQWKTYALSDSTGWYPQSGTVNRATYDVTLHYPSNLDLVASGRMVEEAEEPRRLKRQRRLLDQRSANFSFELGDFEMDERRAGHVDITYAFDRRSKKLSSAAKESIRDYVEGSLLYYEKIFGPYPLDYLTVVTVPRGFSQGLFGFVSLADAALLDLNFWRLLLGYQHRSTLIAHEIAHQWWGNIVGWRSYRDQWLSEAMANYAALLYDKHEQKDIGGTAPITGLGGPLAYWRVALALETEDGRPLESLGPLVLGARLNSTKSVHAYDIIVYQKGAVVLRNVADFFEEEEFVGMLGHMARAGAGRQISTEEFLAALERMSGTDLEWYGQRYVYGTGFPEVDYTYEILPGEDGRWVVRGEAKQRASYHDRLRIVEHSPGKYDIGRERIDEVDPEEIHLIAPVQILVERKDGSEAGSSAGKGSEKASGKGSKSDGDGDDDVGRGYVEGRMVIRGASYAFEVEVPHKPVKFWIDPKRQALARFYCETRQPKRVLSYQALDLAASGKHAEADDAFRRALEAPLINDPEEMEDADTEEIENLTVISNARIHLHRARMYLDLGDSDRAEAAMNDATAVLGREHRKALRNWRRQLEARLALHEGMYESAYDKLRRLIRRPERSSNVEGLMLLAIAAHGAGNERQMRRALEAAAEQGGDVSMLEEATAEKPRR